METVQGPLAYGSSKLHHGANLRSFSYLRNLEIARRRMELQRIPNQTDTINSQKPPTVRASRKLSFNCDTVHLGGKLEVWSEPRVGTEIELRVPASIAYETILSHDSSRQFWRRKEISDRASHPNSCAFLPAIIHPRYFFLIGFCRRDFRASGASDEFSLPG